MDIISAGANPPECVIKPKASPTASEIQNPLYLDDVQEDHPPAFWANRARDCNWPRASTQSRTPGSYLHRLRGMPLLREPILRHPYKRGTRKVVNGEAFDAQIGHDKSNVEAILAYSVGKKMPPSTECHSCARGSGKLMGCVLCPGQTYCASCHWRGMEKRCSFNAAACKATPVTIKASTKSPQNDNPAIEELERATKKYKKAHKEFKKATKSVEKSLKRLKRQEKEAKRLMKKLRSL